MGITRLFYPAWLEMQRIGISDMKKLLNKIQHKWHWFWFKIHLKFLMKEYKEQVDKEIIKMTNNILYNIDYPFCKNTYSHR